MTFTPIHEIKVALDFSGEKIPVGRLALRDGTIYFEYAASFLEKGIKISPLRLPLQPGLKTFDRGLFDGLPGVFNDSLPDGWGRLLLDRALRAMKIPPDELSPLDRLAYVGLKGMGAMIYEPDHGTESVEGNIDLDKLATQAQEVLNGAAQDVLQELLALNGSSAGARPKAMIGLDKSRKKIMHGPSAIQRGFTPWIVKFSNTDDGADSGAIEYVYALMASRAGVDMTDVHLFPAKRGAGYFATKRFDRNGSTRIHSHTACGLLHSDFRAPSMDYEDLTALTGRLTRDVREVEKMFRLAVFNVLAYNRDDHSKNFSFLLTENGEWKLSPAYDLTFSSGPGGEQSTMVMGEGRRPSTEHLVRLGLEAKIDRADIDATLDRTRHALSQWKSLAKEHGVSRENVALIAEKIESIGVQKKP